MSNPASNMNGKLVAAGDQVTIHGSCTSITGTAPSVTETVTFTSLLGDLVTVQAGDLKAPDGPVVSPYYGRSTTQGFAYQATDPAQINGQVLSVTDGPWGFTGVLSVKTFFSGTTISVFSGSVDSHG